jgi:hypothetical protein
MDQFSIGDVIEHRLMPGYTMAVAGTRDCEADSVHPEPHLAYKVTDPEGNEDWLCAMDIQRPGDGLSWGGGTGPRGASVNHGASFSCGAGVPKLLRLSLPPGFPPVTRFGLAEGEQYS